MTLMPEDRKKQQEAMKSVSLNSLVAVPPCDPGILARLSFSDRGVVLGLRMVDSMTAYLAKPLARQTTHLTGAEGFKPPTLV
jgi:hypothetical protein